METACLQLVCISNSASRCVHTDTVAFFASPDTAHENEVHINISHASVSPSSMHLFPTWSDDHNFPPSALSHLHKSGWQNIHTFIHICDDPTHPY